jgi:hypothetical protein
MAETMQATNFKKQKRQGKLIDLNAPVAKDWSNPASEYPLSGGDRTMEYLLIEGMGIEWPLPYEDKVAQAWFGRFHDQSLDDILPFDNETLIHFYRIAPHAFTDAAYWRQLRQAERLMARLLRLQRENAELRRRLPKEMGKHPLFDVSPELPGLIMDAINSGSIKVRKDRDATGFTVTVKIDGVVIPDGKEQRLALSTDVKCMVKCELFREADKSGAPLDPVTGHVIPRSEAYKATPLGRFIEDDPDGPPDAVIYPDEAA